MGSRWTMLTILVFIHQIIFTSGRGVGVNYGRVANNLPPPEQVLNFIASKGIKMVRIFDPNLEVLEALRDSNVNVVVGARNEDLASIASSQVAADDWVRTYIIPYNGSVLFNLISLGNEVIPGPNAQFVVPAMKNIQTSLITNHLGDIKVSTVVSSGVLGTSYPPSQGTFAPELVEIMTQVSKFVHDNVTPLLINVYPYFAYVSDPTHISLDFALFNSTTSAFVDQGRAYYNLFDAMVDAFYAAMVRVVGRENVHIMVSETGWPSAGNEPATCILNAQTYNNNLKNHVLTKGTPRRPKMLLDTFIFALFNENLKTPPGVEQNFGNFYPDLTPVYPLW